MGEGLTEYIEDLKYLEKILKEKKCPYCDYSLHKPYLTKRECQRCDFVLLGNPRYVSYKIKVKPFDFNVKEDQCPECKSTDLFYEKAERELVCLTCGLVLKGTHPYSGYEKINYPFGLNIDDTFNKMDSAWWYPDEEETTWTEDPIKR